MERTILPDGWVWGNLKVKKSFTEDCFFISHLVTGESKRVPKGTEIPKGYIKANFANANKPMDVMIDGVLTYFPAPKALILYLRDVKKMTKKDILAASVGGDWKLSKGYVCTNFADAENKYEL